MSGGCWWPGQMMILIVMSGKRRLKGGWCMDILSKPVIAQSSPQVNGQGCYMECILSTFHWSKCLSYVIIYPNLSFVEILSSEDLTIFKRTLSLYICSGLTMIWGRNYHSGTMTLYTWGLNSSHLIIWLWRWRVCRVKHTIIIHSYSPTI